MLGKNAILATFVASVAYFLFTGNDDHADILTVAMIATVPVLVLLWVVLRQAAAEVRASNI